jgi:hypothetical protein
VAYPAIVERPGSLSITGVSKETSFGVPVVASAFLPMTSNTMEAEPGWFSPPVMTGNRDAQVFNMYGEAKFSGSVEGPLFPSNAIEFLVAAIGTDSVTGSGPYVHALSQANSLPSLTVEKNIGGYQSLQFAGCRVGKLSIKAPVGNEPVSMSADLMGQSVAILTSPTAISITNEIPFVFAEASVTLMSHARADITNFAVDIDNGVKETYTYSGNHGPSFLTPVTVKASGTFDVVFSSLNDSTYGDFSTMEAGTLGSLAVSFAHPGGSGYSVAMTLPQVAMTKVGADIKLEDVVMSTIAWSASRPLTGGSQYTVGAVVTNGVATAY